MNILSKKNLKIFFQKVVPYGFEMKSEFLSIEDKKLYIVKYFSWSFE